MGAGLVFPLDWSRDGQWLVYTEANPKTGADISGRCPTRPCPNGPPQNLFFADSTHNFMESQGQISPDGKWLAYCSDESAEIRFTCGRLPAHRQSRKQVAEPAAGSRAGVRTQSNCLTWRNPLWGWVWTVQDHVRAHRRAPNPAGVPKPLFAVQSATFIPLANNFLYAPRSKPPALGLTFSPLRPNPRSR